MHYSIAMISEHASPLAELGHVDSGGQNVYVARVSAHLATAGHRVDILTRRDDPSLPDVVELQPGVRVVHISAGPPCRIPKERLFGHMPEFTANVLQYLRSQACDLVHANFWMSAMAGLEVKRQLDVPLIVTFHALGKIRRQFQGSDDAFPDERVAIETEVMRDATFIIAECPQDRADQIELYGCDPNKTRLVSCGFDAEECQPLDRAECRRRLGLPDYAFIVLQLGRMVKRKGVDNVIRAISRLRGGFGIDAQLVVVGGDTEGANRPESSEIERLRNIAGEEQVDDLVVFAGRCQRDELRYYYNACDVFVTTPWYEPFGVTPLEAMACGIPVIGSNVGGIKYSVVHGKTGFLVPPNDPTSLAAYLEELYRDSELRSQLGNQGLARVRRTFTWKIVARELNEVYDEAISLHQSSAVRLFLRDSENTARPPTREVQRPSLSRTSVNEAKWRRAVFFDKDGTLLNDVPYNVDVDQMTLTEGAGFALSQLQQAGYAIVVISNQSGVAKGYFREEALQGVNDALSRLLREFGVHIAGFYYCPHHPAGSVVKYQSTCSCRKPAPGMLLKASHDLHLDVRKSWMVGDILDDIEAGNRAGCRTVLVDCGNESEWLMTSDRKPFFIADTLVEAAERILAADAKPITLPMEFQPSRRLSKFGERV